MRTTTAAALLFILIVCAAALPDVSLRAQDTTTTQADAPVYYFVTFSATLQTTVGQPFGAMDFSIIDETGASLGTGGSGPGGQTINLSPVTAKLYPGKNYTLQVNVSGDADATVWMKPVMAGWSAGDGPRGRFLIEGLPAEQLVRSVFGGGTSGGNYKIAISQEEVMGDAQLRGGEASVLEATKPIWYVSLGRTRNGRSAGGVGFRRSDLASVIYTPSALYYDTPDLNEVVRVPASGGPLQQVYSREVLLNIQTLTSTSYKIDVYPRSQVTGQSGGLYTFTGSPIITYTVAQASLPEGTGLKITRVEDSVTWETSLVAVGTTWTHRGWRTSTAPAISKVVTSYPTTTSATVTHSGRNAADTADESPLVWSKTFLGYAWGLELDKRTFGPSEPVKVETQFSYYTTTASDGSVERQLKHQIEPTGGWTKFLYYDVTTSSGQKGAIKRVFRPWLDAPTSPDSASTANSVYEDRTYVANVDGSVTLPSEFISTVPNGNVLQRTTWVHTLSAGSLNGSSFAQEQRRDWSSGTEYVETITRYYRPDVANVYLRGKPVSVQYPDGRKDSYAYLDGNWTEATRSFAAASGGVARAILCLHGQTTGGAAVTNWGTAIDSVQMVANKSLISETIVDSNGRVVLDSTYIYVSPTPLDQNRIARTYHHFDTHGRLDADIDLVRSVGATELKLARSYSSSLVMNETAEDGVVTAYQYDSLLRLTQKTIGSGGTAPYPAKVEQTQYDGANRVKEAYPCACGTAPTIYSYDPAGRLDSKSEASPNGGAGLITDYSYDSKVQTTTGLPTGATRIDQIFLDGRPKSVGGTSEVPVAYTYTATTTGLVTTATRNGALNNGFVETTTDRLGRTVQQAAPTWNYNSSTAPNNVIDQYFDYYTSAAGATPPPSGTGGSGSLYRERKVYRATSTGLTANTIHTYDLGGRPLWTGLDVDDSGTLTTASTDRIQSFDTTVVSDSWGWLSTATVNTYPTAGSGTAKELSHATTRFTGFNNGAIGSSGLVVGDVISFDAAGRWTLRWDFVDATQKRRRSEITQQGVSTVAFSETNNGYGSVSQSSSGVRTQQEYDSLGRREYVRGRWNGSTFAESTRFQYFGNTTFPQVVTTTGTPSDTTATYAYKWGVLEGLPNGHRQVRVTDGGGKFTLTQYNEMDLVRRIWGNATQPVENTYNTLGQRTGQTTWRTGTFDSEPWPAPTGGATTTWVVEAATGLVKEKRYPDHSQTDPNWYRKVVYTYTPLQQLKTRNWPRGPTTTYSYYDNTTGSPGDVSYRTGELKSVSYSDGSSATLNYTYKRTGFLDQVTDATGTRTFAYDANLNPLTETLDAVYYGTSAVLTSTYDGSVPGRPTGYQFANNGATQSNMVAGYDAATGRVSSIGSTLGTAILGTFTYGSPTAGTDWYQTVTQGSGGSAFVRTMQLLPNRSVLDSVATTWGGTDRGTYDSTFNNRGLRATTAESSAAGGVVPTNGTRTFTYNDRAELSGDDFSVGTTRDYTWVYDLMGKRTSNTVNGSSTTYGAVTDSTKDVNTYASITGLQAEPGLTYDADANLTATAFWTFTYDAEDRLKQAVRKDGTKTLQFLYDYLGRRVRKTVRNGNASAPIASSTKFVWAGWKLIAELNAGTAEAQTGTTFFKSYLWGLDFSNAAGAAGGAGGLLALYQLQDNKKFYPVYDTSGNVTGYLDAASGATVATYTYTSYGDVSAQTGTFDSFNFGMSTQYTDRELTRMVYFGLRYYYALEGRFINRDPIEEAGGLNLFSFVGNSPVNAWDVLGLGHWILVKHESWIAGTNGSAGSKETYYTKEWVEDDGVVILSPFTVTSDLQSAMEAVRLAEERSLADGVVDAFRAGADAAQAANAAMTGSTSSSSSSAPNRPDPCPALRRQLAKTQNLRNGIEAQVASFEGRDPVRIAAGAVDKISVGLAGAGVVFDTLDRAGIAPAQASYSVLNGSRGGYTVLTTAGTWGVVIGAAGAQIDQMVALYSLSQGDYLGFAKSETTATAGALITINSVTMGRYALLKGFTGRVGLYGAIASALFDIDVRYEVNKANQMIAENEARIHDIQLGQRDLLDGRISNLVHDLNTNGCK